LSDAKPELEQFAVDARCTPKQILRAHLPDQRAQFCLDLFNSLDAQYDAASAYIKSQAHAGWNMIRSRYDDGGYSGGSTDRPDLQKLLEDIRSRKIDVIVVYKVDRLTRSLAD
jgi:DNA invertase Pin-like site-specific DNA recombinase